MPLHHPLLSNLSTAWKNRTFWVSKHLKQKCSTISQCQGCHHDLYSFRCLLFPVSPPQLFVWVGEPKATGFANGPVSPKAMKEEVYKCACRSLQKATIWGFENSLAQWSESKIRCQAVSPWVFYLFKTSSCSGRGRWNKIIKIGWIPFWDQKKWPVWG